MMHKWNSEELKEGSQLPIGFMTGGEVSSFTITASAFLFPNSRVAYFHKTKIFKTNTKDMMIMNESKRNYIEWCK